ncbi:RtcB family protein [Chitinivorax sp. B]|uniref:RtcB family protein n=1 Tax=Chitinivorax sp. B TaxID=2502235 RepID=UPI0010F98B04|nr:RtcB family protein [Chitinivorax sp. B]
MYKLSRLEKAFLRSGIELSRNGNIVSLIRQHGDTQATILLPEAFPLEEKAVRQLLDFASVHVPGQSGHVCKACATPDFHPGSIAPVGSVVATTPDLIIPAAIGTDINCGMRLLSTGLSLAEVEAKRTPLLNKLTHTLLQNGRDVPMTSRAFTALFDDSPAACLDQLGQQGLWARVDHNRLSDELTGCIGLHEMQGHRRFAPEALMPTTRDTLRDPCLGTPGSGNHFVELQVVETLIDRHTVYQYGLKPDEIVIMIHSGSRNVGFFVGQRWMDRAKAAWPKGIKHPGSGLYGLTGHLASEYLQAMGVAARYAWLNRVVLSEMVRDCLQQVFQQDNSRMIVDIPHNVVLREQGLNIHRKGATPARNGDLALIPGSMGDHSYLVCGLGNADWLWSCSHGAGRSIRRQAMRAVKSVGDSNLPWHCVTLREERKVEEAPAAYKPIGPAIEVQESHGLIRPVAKFRPWVTFKA